MDAEALLAGSTANGQSGGDPLVPPLPPGTEMAGEGRRHAPENVPASPKGLVRAAGALVWREREGVLQVLVVHRPRYDDWSFPKGKLDKGESWRACAVREAAEETGAHIALGRPLDSVRYRLADRREKEVRYWAAHELAKGSRVLAARGVAQAADAAEIDGVQWLSSPQARERLTHPLDRELLDQLVGLWQAGSLRTRPMVLVRHARAVKRAAWKGPEKGGVEAKEATRPVTPRRGRAQAQALVEVLGAYGVEQLVSSPWKRCRQTLAPYAQATGAEPVDEPALTEAAHAAEPHKVGQVVVALAQDGGVPVAVCLHRPTLPTVLRAVSSLAPPGLRPQLPPQDPWLRTGEVLVAHLASGQSGQVRVVALEQHRPQKR